MLAIGRSVRLLLISTALVAVGLFALGARTALAYPPPPATGVLSSTCSSTTPGGATCGLTFTVTNPNGAPASGVQATFTVSGCGSVSPTVGVTNSLGQVSTTFSPSPAGKETCCGKSTITATAADGATAQTTINVSCGVGLPVTSTLGAVTPVAAITARPVWVFPLALASGLVLLASLAALRLSRRSG